MKPNFRETRPIFYISLFLVLVVLSNFTNLNKNMIFSLSFVIAFVILLVYIIKRFGFKALKMFLIVSLFISVPSIILYLTGFFNHVFYPLNVIILVILTVIFAFAALFTIFKLNLLDIVIEDWWYWFQYSIDKKVYIIHST